MNILAIVIPHSDRHTGNYSILHFPLGISYVIASIRKHFPEANIRISDFALKVIFSEEEIKRELYTISNEFKPDFVIFGGMITRFTYINLLSQLLRDVFPQSKLVLGGSAAGSGHHFFIKNNIIDYLVAGEGEEAIIDILNGNVEQNVSILEKGQVKNIQGRMIGDIDSIPMPSYKDFNVDEYVNNSFIHTGWNFMPMIASRGCPFSCNFCYPNFGKKKRIRSEESVIKEMEYLKRNYNIDSIYFFDEIQFLDKSWMERFCNKLIARKLGLKWTCVSRASLFSYDDVPLLRLAKRSGCLRITIGIESGNQKILNRMNKKTTIEGIENSIRIIRKSGIKATGTMLAGYPGETEGTIQDSVDFANRNLLKTSFYCLIPLPGSQIYIYCLKNRIIVDEHEYLQSVSNAGGDASHIMINLTNMDERKYKEQVEKANILVSEVKLRNYLNYYGICRGLTEYSIGSWRSVHLKLKGRLFETP